MAAERHVVPPTPTQLLSMKTRLAAAHRGYSLLKRKADALALRFRQVVSELRESKGQLGSVMKDAFFSLAAARYGAGAGLDTLVLTASPGTATMRCGRQEDNVAGVRIPHLLASRLLEQQDASITASGGGGGSSGDLTFIGLGGGGAEVAACRSAFFSAVETLVALANLQVRFQVLDAALKSTNKRVNSLSHVVIPKLEATIAYIKSETDELEREEYYRLKMVKKKKALLLAATPDVAHESAAVAAPSTAAAAADGPAATDVEGGGADAALGRRREGLAAAHPAAAAAATLLAPAGPAADEEGKDLFADLVHEFQQRSGGSSPSGSGGAAHLLGRRQQDGLGSSAQLQRQRNDARKSSSSLFEAMASETASSCDADADDSGDDGRSSDTASEHIEEPGVHHSLLEASAGYDPEVIF